MEFLLALYWLVAVLAFAAAVTPLCARLFPGFPGRGAALAPGVGFALLAVVAYWLGRVHWSAGVAAVSLLCVVALGAAASRNADRPDLRGVLPPLAVFVAAFALFVAVRAVDPAVHAAGGEKFLDYGLMQSISLADRLPPEDIWFAGRPVRYYYGGLLSVTAFADAVGVPVRYAYNLGLATCFAAPFFLFYAPENSGVGFLPPRSPVPEYLLVWGGFVAVFATYLARRASLTVRQTAAVAAGWVLLLAAFAAVQAASLVVVLPVLAAAWYLRRTDRAGFAAVLVVAGAGILLAVELAYARVWPHYPRAPRWNTVYKTSMQVAVLWGVAGGVAAASLLEPVLARARSALAAARDAATDTESGAADTADTRRHRI